MDAYTSQQNRVKSGEIVEVDLNISDNKQLRAGDEVWATGADKGVCKKHSVYAGHFEIDCGDRVFVVSGSNDDRISRVFCSPSNLDGRSAKPGA